jgi:hypothetical protein
MLRPPVSEEKILSVSKTTLNTARITLSALSEFGFNQENLTNFDSKISTAEALPSETSNRIDLTNLTDDKNEVLYNCETWGRNLRTRIELTFPINSIEVKSFPSKKFEKAINSENKMMSVMEILIKQAVKYHPQLSNFGQTDEIRDAGNTLLENLRSADAKQESQKTEKPSSTQERYQIFRKLYDTVNRINRIGRIVFKNDPVHLALFKSKW